MRESTLRDDLESRSSLVATLPKAVSGTLAKYIHYGESEDENPKPKRRMSKTNKKKQIPKKAEQQVLEEMKGSKGLGRRRNSEKSSNRSQSKTTKRSSAPKKKKTLKTPSSSKEFETQAGLSRLQSSPLLKMRRTSRMGSNRVVVDKFEKEVQQLEDEIRSRHKVIMSMPTSLVDLKTRVTEAMHRVMKLSKEKDASEEHCQRVQ